MYNRVSIINCINIWQNKIMLTLNEKNKNKKGNFLFMKEELCIN
jgi:hypothetical protein